MAAEQKSPRLSKRMKTVRAKVDHGKFYTVDDALALVKETAVAKFDESVDVAVNLGVDAKKSDQTVRGSVVLPAGTGKKVRVAVFAQGDKAKQAQDAGADIVGFDDLAAKIKEGFMEFDVVIASPDAMKVVGQLGQILGPRGLMPNPKVGTVSADVAGAVRNAKAGQVQYRTDKAGIVQCTIGRASFTPDQLKTNLDRADRRPQQGEARELQGHLPQEGERLEHDGRRCAHRHGRVRAGGGVETVIRYRASGISGPVGPRMSGAEGIEGARGGSIVPRAVKDRWGESSNARAGDVDRGS